MGGGAGGGPVLSSPHPTEPAGLVCENCIGCLLPETDMAVASCRQVLSFCFYF